MAAPRDFQCHIGRQRERQRIGHAGVIEPHDFGEACCRRQHRINQVVPTAVAYAVAREKSQVQFVDDGRREQKSLAVGAVVVRNCQQSAERIAGVPAAAASRVVEIEVTDHHAVRERHEFGRRAVERAEYTRRFFTADLARNRARDDAGFGTESPDGAGEAVDETALALVYRFGREVGVFEIECEVSQFL